jgi:hypothetical protein
LLSAGTIHPVYLPYTAEELAPHFCGDATRPLAYFRKVAERYTEFLAAHPDPSEVALSQSRRPRQIESDERFWCAATLKHLFDHPERNALLGELLAAHFGAVPPMPAFQRWDQCLAGRLRLWLEVSQPAPLSYLDWLARHQPQRHLIPFVLDAAKRDGRRPAEGPTTVGGAVVNEDNGFCLMIDVRVLSDTTADMPFDCLRNSLTRGIDAMLEPPLSDSVLATREVDRTLYCMLTPQLFRDHPEARHYAELLIEYMASSAALVRDLPHRPPAALHPVPDRLGWLAFEDIVRHFPRACGWLAAGRR